MKRLSQFGYNINYPENVRHLALQEAVKTLSFKTVDKRLSQMISRHPTDSTVTNDHAWIQIQNQKKKQNTTTVSKVLVNKTETTTKKIKTNKKVLPPPPTKKNNNKQIDII
jgi:hypothetical protein